MQERLLELPSEKITYRTRAGRAKGEGPTIPNSLATAEGDATVESAPDQAATQIRNYKREAKEDHIRIAAGTQGSQITPKEENMNSMLHFRINHCLTFYSHTPSSTVVSGKVIFPRPCHFPSKNSPSNTLPFFMNYLPRPCRRLLKKPPSYASPVFVTILPSPHALLLTN